MDIIHTVEDVPIKLGIPWYYRLPYYTTSMFIIYIVIFMQPSMNYPEPSFFNLAFYSYYGHEYSREAYRWYTYSLLHLNVVHIASNMYNLIIFGTLVEINALAPGAAAINMISILGGAFTTAAYSQITNRPVILVGASGGIFGLLSAQIGNIVINWNQMDLVQRIIYTSVISCAVISEIVVDIVLYNPLISYADHVGGFIFGIFAGFCFMKNSAKHTWLKSLRIGSAIVLSSLLVTGIMNTCFM